MRITAAERRVDEAALDRADLLCRSLLGELPGSSLVVFDRELRVRLAEGPSAERAGMRTDSSAGRALRGLIPAYIYEQLEPHYRAVVEGDERRFLLRTQLGSQHAISAIPVLAADGSVIGGMAVSFDETDCRRTSAELHQRLAQQSAVARLGELALQGADPGSLMRAACVAAAGALDVPLVHVLEHAGEGVMRVRAGLGWEEGFVGSRFEMASYQDPGGRAAYHRGAVVIEDLPNEPLRGRPLRAHGVVSGATVAIGDGAATFGLLGAYATERRPFSQHDLDFLHAVAHVVAAAAERHRTEQRLRHDALHDALTGLPNRLLLLDRLAHVLARSGRSGEPVALYCLDLDHLKVVNDSLGHQAGDELLRAVGPRLRDALRPGDTVARFGGDEFAVLCEGIVDDAHAVRIADRVVRAFDAPFAVEGSDRFTSVSVGVVLARPGGGRAPEELLGDADAAMYRAKERGRARHELFDAALRARVAARLRVEDELRHALDHAPEQLWVAYQPFYRLADRALAGVEALVRWEHPEHGAVSPAQFIPVAEDSGLVVALGERVLHAACGQVARWRELAPGLTLTVNVSARQVAAPGLVETVRAALARSGLPAAALGLEITEGLLLEETACTVETLRGLRALGAGLVLDDFGTGYSSLGYLRRYPLDGIKVDRAFVADLGTDGLGDGAIVEAIVGMARALGMRIIPEGVETAGQLTRLRAIGCEFAQGFHLARPLPPAELEALLRG